MKSCHEVEKQLSKKDRKKYSKLLYHDKNEIDNLDKFYPARFNYLNRMRTIISVVRRIFPVPEGIKIGDFGCSQGNISLILAELGYKVFAIDIDSTSIEYSKMKYEKGEIQWIARNIDRSGLAPNSLDIAIAGELIEHCAYPEEIIEKILRHVRPGGLLILTTPNGLRVKTGLPTFRQVSSKKQRKVFEKRQFGPDGEDHLFLFKMEEIKYILPKKAEITEKGYLGGTILVNKYSWLLFKIFPIQFVEAITRRLSRTPIINRKICNNIYVIVRKELSTTY